MYDMWQKYQSFKNSNLSHYKLHIQLVIELIITVKTNLQIEPISYDVINIKL